jgi:hypothetical protein
MNTRSYVVGFKCNLIYHSYDHEDERDRIVATHDITTLGTDMHYPDSNSLPNLIEENNADLNFYGGNQEDVLNIAEEERQIFEEDVPNSPKEQFEGSISNHVNGW